MFDFFRKHQSTLGEYFRSEIRPFRFPASIDNITVEEVSSLLRQVNQILREIQNDRFFRFTPISNLMVLYYNLLGKKKLPILKVFSSAADEEGIRENRRFDRLQETTREIINKFREGLERRYFDRYHPVMSLKSTWRSKFKKLGKDFSFNAERMQFSYLFDICQFFSPLFRTGRLVRGIISKRVKEMDNNDIPIGLNQEELVALHFNNLQKVVQDQIVEYAKQNLSDLTISPADAESEPVETSKKVNRGGFNRVVPRYIEDDKFSVDGVDSNDDMPLDVEQKVREEITSYLGARAKDLTTNVAGDNPTYEFWKRERDGPRFPVLARVALAFLSTKASSAAIERDFSPISDILSRKRSSLQPWFLEILLSLKLNFNLLPLKLENIPQLSKTAFEEFRKSKERNQKDEEILTGRYSDGEDDSDPVLWPDDEVLEQVHAEVGEEQDTSERRLSDILDNIERRNRGGSLPRVETKTRENDSGVAPEVTSPASSLSSSSMSSNVQGKTTGKRKRALKGLEMGGQKSPILGRRRSTRQSNT